MIDAFGTVLLGSWTRINGAGMTCPDWPACHGQLVPSLANGTIWEWTHRLLAVLLTPLVIAVIALAWRERKRLALLIPATMLAGVLFIAQVLLGAATVHLANSPLSVVLHWATAMAFIASLAAITVFAWATNAFPLTAPPSHQTADETLILGALAGTAFIAFVTMCVGAYVSSSGAGLACLSIPGCAGNVIVYSAGQYVQMVHRCIAGATLICAAGVFALAWVRQTSVRVRVMTTLGLGLVFVQVLLGLLNVVMRLPMDLREAHAANAALVFLTFVVAALFALLDIRNFAVGSSAFPASHPAVHTP